MKKKTMPAKKGSKSSAYDLDFGDAGASWIESAEKGGGAGAIRWPEGMETFQPDHTKKRMYEISLVPYKVTKQHHLVKQGKLKPGQAHYCLEYYVHRNVGANDEIVVCPARNYNKPCPICEEFGRLRRKKDWEAAKAFKAKQRMAWNIVDHGEKVPKVRGWDTPFFMGFGEMLAEELKDNPKLMNSIARPDNGYTIKVYVTEGDYEGRKFTEIRKLEITKREEDLDPALLKEAAVLEECLVPPPEYKELKRKFEMGEEETEKEDEEAEDEETEDEDEDEESEDEENEEEGEDEEEEEPEIGDLVTWRYKGKKMKGRLKSVKKRKGKEPLAMVKVKDQENLSAVDLGDLIVLEKAEDDTEYVDEEEDEGTPVKKKTALKKGKKKVEEEEDEDEEDEEEDEDEETEDDGDGDEDVPDSEGDDEDEEEEGEDEEEEEEDVEDDDPFPEEDEEEEEEEEEEKPKKKSVKKRK